MVLLGPRAARAEFPCLLDRRVSQGGDPLPWGSSEAPRTANEVLGFTVPLPRAGNYSIFERATDDLSVYRGGVLDVRGHQNIFLHSENLTNNLLMAPNGNRSVIRRIGVNQPWGSVLQSDPPGLGEDYVPAGSLSLKTLQFSLRGSDGRLVLTRGVNLSFSLIFAPGVGG